MDILIVLAVGFVLLAIIGSIVALTSVSRINDMSEKIRKLDDKINQLLTEIEILKGGRRSEQGPPPAVAKRNIQQSAARLDERMSKRGFGNRDIPAPVVVPLPTTETSAVSESTPAESSEQKPTGVATGSDADRAEQSLRPPEKPSSETIEPAPDTAAADIPATSSSTVSSTPTDSDAASQPKSGNAVSSTNPSLPIASAPTQSPTTRNQFGERTRAQPRSANEADKSVESIIGKRWLTWAGIGLFFLGSAFFLKYAYDQDWLGGLITPPIRIGLIAIAAVVMLVSGLRFLGRGWTALGQGLSGGGIALFYLAIYGAITPALYIVHQPLFSPHVAFVLMALTTMLGMGLAVRSQAMVTAIIAVIGGFATPILVSTGGGSRETLFAYILILDLGVLAAAWFRRWQALDVLAFVGTVIMYAGWFASREHPPYAALPLMAWLMIFHLIFLCVPFAYHWRQRTAVSVSRFVIVACNLAFIMSYAGYVLRTDHPYGLASICLGLAALYTVFGFITHHRIPDDKKIGHCFFTIGVLLVMLSLLYFLPSESVATAWFVESIIVLYLGLKYRHMTTHVSAWAVYGFALLRLLTKQMPAMSAEDAFILNSWLASLLIAPLTMAIWAVLYQRLGTWTKAPPISWWICAGMLLLIGSLEIVRVKSTWVHVPMETALGMWWFIGAVLCFVAGRRWTSPGTITFAVSSLLIALISSLWAYRQSAVDGWAVLNVRFIVTGIIFISCLLMLRSLRRRPVSQLPGLVTDALPWVASLVPMAVGTLEVVTWTGDSSPITFDVRLYLVMTWTGLALTTFFAKHVLKDLKLALMFFVPIICAVFTSFLLYAHDIIVAMPFLNLRCLSGIAAIATLMVGIQLAPTQRWLLTCGHMLLTAIGFFEIVNWCTLSYQSDTYWKYLLWMLSLWFAGSAFIGFLRQRLGGPPSAYVLGVVLLIFSGFVTLLLFVVPWHAHLPVFNLRWFAVTVVAAVLFVVRRWIVADVLKGYQAHAAVYAWVLAGFLFYTMTAETITYIHDHISNRTDAARIANFAVTALWTVMALASLIVGFMRLQRIVRLTALILFGITALKLLIYDMHGVNQLYRIAAFMLVGVALIVASYIYHRLEKRLNTKADVLPPNTEKQPTAS